MNPTFTLITQQFHNNIYLLQRNTPCFFACDFTPPTSTAMALNISCSKAILGTHVPMSVPKSAHNTPNFFFTAIDRKGCNFAFPKLVQNQGLFPLHSVPSETMVLSFFTSFCFLPLF